MLQDGKVHAVTTSRPQCVSGALQNVPYDRASKQKESLWLLPLVRLPPRRPMRRPGMHRVGCCLSTRAPELVCRRIGHRQAQGVSLDPPGGAYRWSWGTKYKADLGYCLAAWLGDLAQFQNPGPQPETTPTQPPAQLTTHPRQPARPPARPPLDQPTAPTLLHKERCERNEKYWQ